MTEIDWSDVRPRIAVLAGLAGAAEVFGAISHGWRLAPALTADELAELEGQLGVELPVDYGSFLTDVSRGGAGPAYGLFPVRRVEGRWAWEGDGASLNDRETLTRPFGHIRAFNPADDLDNPPQIGRNDDALWELHDEVLSDPAHVTGLLYLCHLGCALREALVVTGPSRGQMWADDTADGEGFRPLHNPDSSRMTFAAWYRTWLRQSERTSSER
ncbi:hypothetical protein ACWT_5650 [Actinoplanes sp. SE50]|uniref:SMI1/KNR4 family protein n=1 Tax=unclassified Actinoplanes TaxID=2626549 RepID=UPI00023ED10E|nr:MULTISPECIES: SMI1/KNR4 family protein [unclassified Actinoplanes]AEV86667.1 hypothetical protein ACPL_5780 [Actinoplanes sp. SE50/110]ATO85065.1 hypothetical protein ACWT_5650 [Actinoplanes sp. SE50]SLM02476.1 hypothetical protein ACSP50_5726 [Actinoplanes sp. SE50/110]